VNARTPDDLDQVARGNRLAFHLCLPFGFLPGVSVLFVGGTLFWAFHRARTEAAHYWARMIGWLAVLDLVVLGFIVLMAIGPFEIHEHEREGPKPPRMQIGIFFDQEAPEGQIVIGTVRPGLPAEGAGLEPGDIIVAVDGLDIFSRAELAGILVLPAFQIRGNVAFVAVDGGCERSGDSGVRRRWSAFRPRHRQQLPHSVDMPWHPRPMREEPELEETV